MYALLAELQIHIALLSVSAKTEQLASVMAQRK